MKILNFFKIFHFFTLCVKNDKCCRKEILSGMQEGFQSNSINLRISFRRLEFISAYFDYFTVKALAQL